MLIFLDESNLEEQLSQPLELNNEQYKIAITFLVGYNRVFLEYQITKSILQNQLLMKMVFFKLLFL